MYLAQVIFESGIITNQMALPAAVEWISKLLIYVTDKGNQDASYLIDTSMRITSLGQWYSSQMAIVLGSALTDYLF